MNNLKHLVYSVKDNSTKVMKDLALHCGITLNSVRNHMNDPYRRLSAEDALRMLRFFRRHFECEIDDLIILEDDKVLKKMKLVSIDEVRSRPAAKKTSARRREKAQS
jgi:hypothetical protein